MGYERSKPNFRLPKDVLPVHQELHFDKIDPQDDEFLGHTKISLCLDGEVSIIKLNAERLAFSECYVTDDNGTVIQGQCAFNNDLGLVTITLPVKIDGDGWSLFIRFSGSMTEKLRGLHRVSWEDDSGKEHWIATTQFEPIDARRAFPCFDEPEFKVTSNTTLTVPAQYTAISNGRVVKEEALDGGWKRVHFSAMPAMSTYLFCFIVGDFVSTAPVHAGGVELRVWTVPGMEHLTSFGMKAASFALDWYVEYFKRPYFGGDKIDLIAIPNYATGAMENTGCITFRSTSLLVDTKTATQAELRRVDEVVKHELAHMWFGDEVTMDWWDGLWLNESFATDMAFMCMNAQYPEWHVWDTFALDKSAAFRMDSLKTTHPIQCEIEDPAKMRETFDAITYEKGGAKLKALRDFIGWEAYRDGIAEYLDLHALHNTKSSDLWDCIEESCGQHGVDVPVRRLMDFWIFTPGHPIIQVDKLNDDGVRLRQRQFLFMGATKVVWPIPVTMSVSFADGEVVELKFVFDEAEKDLTFDKPVLDVVVNKGGSGFYRVRYSPYLASWLTADLLGKLSVVERFQLVNDSWAAVRAGMASAADHIELLKVFAVEDDPNVWLIMLGSLEAIHSLMKGKARRAVEKIIHDLTAPAVARLGWTPRAGESVQISELRGKLIGALGTTGGDEATRAEAVRLFDEWKVNHDAVAGDVVPAIVRILAYTGDEARFNEFLSLSSSADTPQMEERFLFALGDFRDLELLKRMMGMILTPAVKEQDKHYLLYYGISNEISSAFGWNYLKENWNAIIAACQEDAMMRIIGVVSLLDTPDQAADVRSWLRSHPIKYGEMSVARALEGLELNLALRQREEERLTAHLETHFFEDGDGTEDGAVCRHAQCCG